ncbi:chorismate synthase, chloroplastic isoform X1 [Mangifera indica]|uniref:chorismate synthase, chloroplastic isoform X1 n=2 Tax=Mangifera indica TaxID=29780 RepID=UPI001CF9788E|nr:chorismate synthase, chloroplastic isoform X1 [Mangifera indica]
MAAASIASKQFLAAPRTEGSLSSRLPSDLCQLPSPPVKIVFHSATPKKLQIKAAGSTYGTYFRVTTFGESHGGGVGCIIDGCPPRIPLSEADMQFDLDRRRPGQSRITTPRKETDTCKIQSGVSEGVTTGTPIHVFVPNTDQRGHDYSEMSVAYRPSHADATYDMKYGVRSVQGGGRSSARETIGRVAAGAVAKKILRQLAGTEILAYVSQAHKVVLPEDLVDHEALTLDQIESNIARCPDSEYAEKMIAAIDAVRVRGDSVGGVVTCIVRNAPRGLGSPVFDKLEAELAKAAMSLPATKGFEFGSGFAGTFMTGSEHNDEFYTDEYGNIRTRTNRSGGIQGGISNGEIINMRIAFKPTSTIGRKQNTVTRDKKETELIARGRHDPCVVPRAVPMVEAMVSLVLVDQLMAQYAQCYLFPPNPELQTPFKLPSLEPAEML